MNKLSYIIITRNRQKVLKDHIDTIMQTVIKNDCRIYVMDGSDSESENLFIKNYDKDFVNYFYLPDKSFAERIIEGINQTDCEYFCITGDSQILNVKNFYLLQRFFDKQYDIIEFSHRDNKHIGYKEYHNIIDYFKDNAWDMTIFGTVYMKRDLIEKKLDVNDLIKKYGHSYFFQIIVFFDLIKETKYFKGVYCNIPIITFSKYKIGNNWSTMIFDVFGVDWITCIDNLDQKYDIYKTQVIIDHGKYSSLKLDRLEGLLRLRMTNQLNFKAYQEYKRVFPRLTTINLNVILITCLFPKYVLIKLYNIIKILKRYR